jgi:hypothetical protein
VNQIHRIAPVSDADAARLVSNGTLADLAEQITRTPAGQAAAAARSRAWPRWRLAVIMCAAAGAAAVALIVSTVAHSGAGTSTGGAGRTAALRPDAHALAFTRVGGYIDVIVRDPLADQASYNAEFKAHGLDITLSLVPVSPSLVGTVVEVSTSGPDGDSITTITAKGRCWTGGGGSQCPVGLRVPLGYHGQAALVFGRAARPGEQYESTTSASAPGEVMHGLNYVGKPVSVVLAMLKQRHVTVPTYRDDGQVLAPDQVPGTWYVYSAVPWAPHQVLLFVGPARQQPPIGTPRPAPSRSGQ